MPSNPVPVKKKDKEIAIKYLLGTFTRADVNRAYKLRDTSASGLHRVARASRQLVLENPEVEKAVDNVRLTTDKGS